MKIYLAIWAAFMMVPGPCPEHRPGCLTIHYKKAWIEHKRFFFEKDKAAQFCVEVSSADKADCQVQEMDEAAMNLAYGYDPVGLFTQFGQ